MTCLECGVDLHYTNRGGLCRDCKQSKQSKERQSKKDDEKIFSQLSHNEKCCLVHIYKYLDNPTHTQISDICSSFGVSSSKMLEHVHLKNFVKQYCLYRQALNKGGHIIVTLD